MTETSFSPDLLDGVDEQTTRVARLSDRARALAATPGLATWIGLALATVGAVLIAVAWVKTAGQLEVGRQVPYLLSAGFTGMGLIVVGITVVNVAAKTQESARRREQADELTAVLAGIRRGLEGRRP